jgi:hypothetical protein
VAASEEIVKAQVVPLYNETYIYIFRHFLDNDLAIFNDAAKITDHIYSGIINGSITWGEEDHSIESVHNQN